MGAWLGDLGAPGFARVVGVGSERGRRGPHDSGATTAPPTEPSPVTPSNSVSHHATRVPQVATGITVVPATDRFRQFAGCETENSPVSRFVPNGILGTNPVDGDRSPIRKGPANPAPASRAR
ncbi:hypothetical protein GCM10027590_40830 [Nocardiopsis nanhaiensis]